LRDWAIAAFDPPIERLSDSRRMTASGLAPARIVSGRDQRHHQIIR
jgi:hypothetical protein